MLPLNESGTMTRYAPTHISSVAYDHIFTTAKLTSVEIVRPPYPQKPNDWLKMVWTDHFLVRATVN